MTSPLRRSEEVFAESRVELRRVMPELIDAVWLRFLKQIRKGLSCAAGDSTTPELFLRDVKLAKMIGWGILVDDDLVACAFISTRQFPAKMTVNVELIVGEHMDIWASELEDTLIDYRDLIGADAIEGLSRDGMVRRLSKRWKRKATLMELTR